MSGVGEALAIVSCVAGLIQAYDAGSRIVKQIKARRQVHDALPPSDLLEESIEKGKRQIEEVVADGNRRFGSSFEEGDTTAQLALMKITIATQNALLAGLTQARDDDGVIDFDTCIDTSDKGRVDALVALHALFQRKLDEEMDRKKNLQMTQGVPQAESPTVTSPAVARSGRATVPPTSTALERPPAPSSPPTQELKKSRTLTDVVFRRKEKKNPTQMCEIPLDRQCDITPKPHQQDMPSRKDRRNTGASTSSSATWSSADSRSSVGNYDSTPLATVGSARRSYTESTPFSAPSRHGTSLSTASTLAPITSYGGCCKNAHELRNGSKKALSRALVGIHGTAVVYTCASTKCHFKDYAIQKNKGWEVDDRIRLDSSGLRYRWLFLAKSHMQQQDPSERYSSFRCLICTMLGDEPGTFRGSKTLLAHVAGHQGGYLGETQLDGPLVFSNQGVNPAFDEDFDIDLSKPTPKPVSPVPDHGAAVVVAANVTAVSHMVGTETVDKGSSAITYQEAHDYNPWVT
ncbi:hypothetical protein PV11_05479 [Exophiala sideris]|uniref:Uncharacterized protein n=1 Tax=Exophiala sideris TaxID=1016849 RepID=A0A0D1X6Q0_9EURO|nr:hypothetical protein PV11_05479 [Exophiala sideris]